MKKWCLKMLSKKTLNEIFASAFTQEDENQILISHERYHGDPVPEVRAPRDQILKEL